MANRVVGVSDGETEIAVVGAGAAGLSLAYRLCSPPPGVTAPAVTLVEAPPGPLRPPERTWCFWEAGHGDYDEMLTASWDCLRVRGPAGTPVARRPAPLRYKMLRSADFEREMTARIARSPGLSRVEAVIDDITDAPDGARLRGVTPDGSPLLLTARWVFDSRPLPAYPPARTALLQHFRGWFVRTEQPVFDPEVADWMDFRTPQPRHGLAFGYVLPTSRREALVEYTQFSPAVLDDAGYDGALRHYTRNVLGLGRFVVTATEQGVIPMTDARPPRRAGSSVFRIGTAGGATRPSTGYTFAAAQRQARAVAAARHAHRAPVPPPAHSRWSRTMDAVLLRALDSGRIDGPAFFTRLFRQVPAERLLRFLDGGTTPAEDLAIGLRTPVLPMLRTVAELPVLRRRPVPGPALMPYAGRHPHPYSERP